MRRAIALLLILAGLALVAFGLLLSFAGNCARLERESHNATAAMELCTHTVGCQFNYRDIIVVARQQHAAEVCQARR